MAFRLWISTWYQHVEDYLKPLKEGEKSSLNMFLTEGFNWYFWSQSTCLFFHPFFSYFFFFFSLSPEERFWLQKDFLQLTLITSISDKYNFKKCLNSNGFMRAFMYLLYQQKVWYIDILYFYLTSNRMSRFLFCYGSLNIEAIRLWGKMIMC